MKFYSTKNKNEKVNFRDAILSGIAPDGGLFMPENFPQFSAAEKKNFAEKNFAEVAFEISKKFCGDEIPEKNLEKLIFDAFDFPIKLKKIDEKNFVLELFHGPTAAFKDFAARFMARISNFFLAEKKEKKTILVATSGDTGGAVAAGFLGLPNFCVKILFPKNGVSEIQKAQLTGLGKNISAIEIDGSFDDCQNLVKKSFLDRSFSEKLNLMSANSINVGRVIPQSFYYFWASAKLQKKFPDKKIIFCVPSGNFGNLTAAIFAQKMGAPLDFLIAANNSNRPFFDFLRTGNFSPRPTVRTISNAMDIGHPNNFYRIFEIFSGGDFSAATENEKKITAKKIREKIFGATFSDDATAAKIAQISREKNYVACPHTAVGFCAIENFCENFSAENKIFVNVATADPAKFREKIQKFLPKKILTPANLEKILAAKKVFQKLPPDFVNFKKFLLEKI